MKPKTAVADPATGEEWDARSKVTLIHCYRDEPSIWNTNVTYRSDADRRQSLNEAWKRIEQRMSAMGYNFDLPQLKKKMKQLRDQFSRENKMFEDHSSKWQFYEEMRFLNQEETPNPPFTTLSFTPLQLQSISPMIAESSCSGEEGLLLNGTKNVPPDCCSSLDIEVKSEDFGPPREDPSLISGHGKSGSVVSSNGIAFPGSVVDELFRMKPSPSARKRRLADVDNAEEDAQRSLRASVDIRKENEKISKTAPQRESTCGCHFENSCLKEGLLEMVKAQKEYFKVAAEAQKEQLRLFSALGDVLNRVSAKLLPPDPEHR